MTPVDRRTLLLLSGGLLLNGCRTMADGRDAKLLVESQAFVVRPRWIPGKDQDFKAKYIHAVTLLKANDEKTFPKQDPNDINSFLSWKKILLLHQKSCQHSNWFLLPWHRLYLVYFESACQLILNDPTFAVPYWDWTLDPAVPSEFYEVPVLQAKRDLQPGEKIPEELVGKAVIDSILAGADFFAFHSSPPDLLFSGQASVGRFEGTPHNGVHNTVGGIMGNTSDSPTDPVFWLHHCNIDRLWALWLSMHPDTMLPFTAVPKTDDPTNPGVPALPRIDPATGFPLIDKSPSGWGNTLIPLDRKESFPGVTLPQSLAIPISGKLKEGDIADRKVTRDAASSLLARDLVASEKFGYLYDTQMSSTINGAIIGSGRKKFKDAAHKTLSGKRDVGTDILQSKVALPTDIVATIRAQLKKRIANSSAISVSFAAMDLPIPSDEALRKQTLIRFFILDPNGDYELSKLYAEQAFKLPEYVGSYTFFTMGAMHQHGKSDPTLVSTGIDVTEWLSKRLAQGELSELTLIVVAVNAKKQYKGEKIFNAASKADLQIQLLIQDEA